MYNKFIIVQFYIQYFLYVPYFPYGISIHVDMLRIRSWGIPARGKCSNDLWNRRELDATLVVSNCTYWFKDQSNMNTVIFTNKILVTH